LIKQESIELYIKKIKENITRRQEGTEEENKEVDEAVHRCRTQHQA
jgi:hypothetical protein